MSEELEYEKFSKHMAEKYPRYFGEGTHYGGFAIGAGWYQIVESLVGQIDHYIKWRRNMRAYDLRINRARLKGRDDVLKVICNGKEPRTWDEDRADDIMEEERTVTQYVPWIRVEQIKEKFGGLRFYYQGGDDTVDGMVRMAEVWASQSCETCGNKGKRRDGGWVRTLCDEHAKEK